MEPTDFSGTLIETLWGIWSLIWLAASFRNKKTRRRETWLVQLAYFWPVILSIPVFNLISPEWLLQPLFPRTGAIEIISPALVACGLGFALWARWHLKGNWSGNVTVKIGHELIRNGPYAYVRHPIYAGLLLAMLGTCLEFDCRAAVLVLVLGIPGLLQKIMREERFMTDEFGDEYIAYRRHVRRLVPFVW